MGHSILNIVAHPKLLGWDGVCGHETKIGRPRGWADGHVGLLPPCKMREPRSEEAVLEKTLLWNPLTTPQGL